MALDAVDIAAELRQQRGAAELIGLEPVLLEIHVQAAHIAEALVVPAAGRVDRAGLVHGPDDLHGRLAVKLAPALVERHPHGDARVVVERGDHVAQLVQKRFARRHVRAAEEGIPAVVEVPARHERGGDDERVVALAAAGHVLPDEHAQPVAVIVPAVALDLDVLAQHVEAHVLGQLDVIDERVVARRGVEPVRPVALIEQAVVKIRLAIEKQAAHAVRIRLDAALAHGKVAVDRVVPERHAEGVERRVLRRPGAKRLHRHVRRHARGEREALALEVDHALTFALDGDLHLMRVKQRRHVQGADVVLRHALEPDRLPDAALRRVPDAVRVQRLLAARELGLVRRVAHAHKDRVFLGQHLGDVHRERQVAARVRGQLHAVAPHGRGLVDRAEVQQHAADVESVRQRDRADVPQIFLRLQDVSHAGQFALGREGHKDRAVGLRGLVRARRDRVAPRAVEIQVAVARHLRPGILRQGLRAVERIRPGCQHNVASFLPAARRQRIYYLFYRIFPRLLSPEHRIFSAPRAAAAKNPANMHKMLQSFRKCWICQLFCRFVNI